MATKWRPQTRPVQGYELARIHGRIDEIERGRGRTMSGIGMVGGPPPGPGAVVQAGKVTTDGGTGKATMTFPIAYPAAPNVVVSPLNSGADMIIAEVESVSATQVVVSTARVALQGSTGLYTGAGEAHQHSFSGVTFGAHAHAPGTFAAAAHDHAPGTFAAVAHDHAPGTFSAASHDHAPGTFSVTVPAGTDGSAGTFGVGGASYPSGSLSLSGVSASSGPHGVAGVSASSGPHSVSGTSDTAGGGTASGYTDSESGHRHPAPADNVEHRHGKELIGGVLVYWIASPTTL